MNLCECGCGKECNRRFVRGHNNKNKHFSDEHKNKMSENSWIKGKHLSKETKEKMSLANIGTHHIKETKKKISESNIGKHSRSGWHLSEEHKNNISKAMIGDKNHFYNKHHTEETKKNISENSWMNGKTGKNHPNYGKIFPIISSYGIISVCSKGHKVRSSYEKLVADWLYFYNIKFTYESERFFLSKEVTYLPDFYLPEWELYIETKGYMSPENMIQHELFAKAGYELLVVDNVDNLDETLSFLLLTTK